jgi:hypothetical protein
MVIQQRLANDRRVRAGLDASVADSLSEDRLRVKVDEGTATVETKLDVHSHKATAGRNRLGRGLDEAKEKVSAAHGLGDQADGRSAKQQLDKKPPEKTGGGSGSW